MNQPSIMEMHQKYRRNTGYWKINRQRNKDITEAEFTGDTN